MVTRDQKLFSLFFSNSSTRSNSNSFVLSFLSSRMFSGVSFMRKADLPIRQTAEKTLGQLDSSNCSSDSWNSSVGLSLLIRSSEMLSNSSLRLFMMVSTLACSPSFLAWSSMMCSSCSFLMMLRLSRRSFQYTSSYRIFVFKCMKMEGFFISLFSVPMNRHSLSQSQWMRSMMLRYSGEQGLQALILKAFSYSNRAVMQSFISTQIMPRFSCTSAIWSESSPCCSLRSSRAFWNIFKALLIFFSKLYKMPMLKQQSPASCPRHAADFMKQAMAFLTKPSSAKQPPSRKQQFEASQECFPKAFSMCFVQSTQYLTHYSSSAQLRLAIVDTRFIFLWKISRSLSVKVPLTSGMNSKLARKSCASARQFCRTSLALILSPVMKKARHSAHTEAAYSYSSRISFVRALIFLSKSTITFASSRHKSNSLLLQLSQNCLRVWQRFFMQPWRSQSVSSFFLKHLFLWLLRQSSIWWSLQQQQTCSHLLQKKHASLLQIQHLGIVTNMPIIFDNLYENGFGADPHKLQPTFIYSFIMW